MKNEIIKIVFFTVLQILILNGCIGKELPYISYSVYGTKTNVTITYRDFLSDTKPADMKTVFVEKLPWNESIYIEENKLKDKAYQNIKYMVLTVSSESEGRIFTSIQYMNTHTVYDSTENYLETSFK